VLLASSPFPDGVKRGAGAETGSNKTQRRRLRNRKRLWNSKSSNRDGCEHRRDPEHVDHTMRPLEPFRHNADTIDLCSSVSDRQWTIWSINHLRIRDALRAPNSFPDRLSRPFHATLRTEEDKPCVGLVVFSVGWVETPSGAVGHFVKSGYNPVSGRFRFTPRSRNRSPTHSVDCLRISPGDGHCWRISDLRSAVVNCPQWKPIRTRDRVSRVERLVSGSGLQSTPFAESMPPPAGTCALNAPLRMT
jgi:hypothetical protein